MEKGVGHIEVIVSFSIFVVFLLFVFAYLNPIKKPDVSNVLLDIIESNIEKNYTITVTILPFTLNQTIAFGKCFKIKNPFNLVNIPLGLRENSTFVKDIKGNDLAFEYVDHDGMLNYYANITIQSNGENFYVLYFTERENFSSTEVPLACIPLEPNLNFTYNFSIPRTIKIYSERKLRGLNESYYSSNYEQIKGEITFPKLSDFYIKIEDFVMNRTIPPGIPVVAREVSAEILKQEGTAKTIKGTRMNIKVW